MARTIVVGRPKTGKTRTEISLERRNEDGSKIEYTKPIKNIIKRAFDVRGR
jgi:hypothetical protein